MPLGVHRDIGSHGKVLGIWSRVPLLVPVLFNSGTLTNECLQWLPLISIWILLNMSAVFDAKPSGTFYFTT